MIEPVKFIFFCSETDYPKFLALLPEHFPPTYEQFVTAVNQCIKNRLEQVTVEKTNVGMDEFLKFCEKTGKSPDYQALVACTFETWGRNNGFHSTY